MDDLWYNIPRTTNLGDGTLRKGDGAMETFQTILLMLAFGTFVLALLTYIDKRK